MVCYRVKVLTGEGVEDDPVRHVIYWFTENGEEILRDDLWKNKGLTTS